jgi:Mrp family chromosome partitioning ATPase
MVRDKNNKNDSGCQSGGAAAADQDTLALKENMARIAHKILVLSGKGGVGKSTVAANLAVALAARGLGTGLLDIDIHGPSAPKLLGLDGARLMATDDGKIIPVDYSDHLKMMSVGFMLNSSDDAVIWRGPLKYGIIKQFLKDVLWGNLDYLIVDSPPGTGDEPLSVCQLIGDADGAVIVTTPQDVALIDVRKSINFCRQLNMPVLGVVENMSGFVCPHCGKESSIFKNGGGRDMAHDMGVPFLGSIPLEPAIVEQGDAGRPFHAAGANEPSPAQRAFAEIVEALCATTGGKK